MYKNFTEKKAAVITKAYLSGLKGLQIREVGKRTKGDLGLRWARSGHIGVAVEDSTLNGSDSQQIRASPPHPQSLPLAWEPQKKRGKLQKKKMHREEN